MNCWVEIFQYDRLVYKQRFQLWTVEEMSWDDKAKSRERQLNTIVARLRKAMPFFDPDKTKIFVTLKSKMSNGEIPDIQEVQEREGVYEVEQ